MTRTVINGKLVVGGVEAACEVCVFCTIRYERCARGPENLGCTFHAPRPLDGMSTGATPALPASRFCGEFLSREPKESP